MAHPAVLTIDIGNTDIKFALWDRLEEKCFHNWRIQVHYQDADLANLTLKQCIQREIPSDIQLEGACYSSVVPAFDPILEAFLQNQFGSASARAARQGFLLIEASPSHMIQGGLQSPVILDSYPEQQLGADRWVNLIGVQALAAQRPSLVMDFGTATTLDALSSEGHFLGGVIAPGWRLFQECLPKATARLPFIDFQPENPLPSIMGTTTEGCMRAGITLGYHGAIAYLLSQLLNALQAHEATAEFNPLLIATGGAAPAVLSVDNGFPTLPAIHHDPLLTHRGLMALFQFNTEAATVSV